MAASGQVSLRVQLTHDSNKYDVTLNLPPGQSELTLAHLSKEVARIIDVPVGKQKLICKGKSLTDQFASLKSLGVKNNGKIMVIGKRANPEQDVNSKAMDVVESECRTHENRLVELEAEVDGVKKGYLPADLVTPAVKKLRVRVRSCAEDLTRLLEKLDALTLSDVDPALRQRRKTIVTLLQVRLERCDQLDKELKERDEK